MPIKLSLLIPCTHSRSKTFLPIIMESILSQWESLDIKYQNEVEILFLIDNKKMTLGTKRNSMIDIAQGTWVSHIDSDDRIDGDYILELLKATETGADIICFDVSVTLNGEPAKICHYSKDYHSDFNTDKEYFRLPNHIMCVKRELALKVDFKPIIYGEDAAYSKELKPLLKSEYQINKILYHYDFNSETTETQEHLKEIYKQRGSQRNLNKK